MITLDILNRASPDDFAAALDGLGDDAGRLGALSAAYAAPFRSHRR